MCEVTETNVPAKWFKNGMELQPSETMSMEMDGKVHRLVLRDTHMEDTAEYTVIIKDKDSSAKLTVEGQFLLMIICLKLRINFIKEERKKIFVTVKTS